MSGQSVSSFVLRFNEVGYDDELKQRQWRIKVTHVQGEEEIIVKSMNEAMSFMQQVLERE